MSEMWTKTSLPPSDGVIKPWPLEREKYLHTPVNRGPSAARAVAEQVLLRRVGSGLGMRKPLIGDGERSLCLHAGSRSDSDAGEPGDPGDLSGGVVDRGASIDVASDMAAHAGHNSFAYRHLRRLGLNEIARKALDEIKINFP